MTTHRRALFFVHIVALLFGLVGVFGELIDTSAGGITLGRALFAAGMLAMLALRQRRPFRSGPSLRQAGALALSGCCIAVHWVTFFVAVKVGGIAVATLGFASFPAFVTVLEAVFFREAMRRTEWALLGLVTLGLILVTPSLDLADRGTTGLAWGIASGFSFALMALVNRHSAGGIPPLQAAFGQNLVVAIVMLPFAAGDLATLSAPGWFWIAMLGIFCTGLAHFLFVSSLAALKARTASMIIALEPVYAIGFAWILFQQQPGARMLLGAAIIILAIVASSLR